MPVFPLVIDPVLSWGRFVEGNLAKMDQYLFAIQLDPVDGLLYAPCTNSICQTIVIYNDGISCGADSPFPSECPPDLDATDVRTTQPSLDLSRVFF